MNAKEPLKHYLTDEQLKHFRSRLINWKMELLKESDKVKSALSEKNTEPDMIDSACNIVNQTIELRTKDRARKLIHKIDEAIERIDNKTYGYCEETNAPIGYNRLEARPIATLCIEAQEIHEKKQSRLKKESSSDDE